MDSNQDWRSQSPADPLDAAKEFSQTTPKPPLLPQEVTGGFPNASGLLSPSQQRFDLEDGDVGFKQPPPLRQAPELPIWRRQHHELVDFVNSFVRRKAWLPADFERAIQAIDEIDRTDSLADLEGDSKTRREAYAKEITECNRMIFKLRRIRKRAWEHGLGWPKASGGPMPPRGR